MLLTALGMIEMLFSIAATEMLRRCLRTNDQRQPQRLELVLLL
ncbi:hypothetical protein [Chloroflexus sp.]|nr:hypothetical protein [Chloroflexus sp.]